LYKYITKEGKIINIPGKIDTVYVKQFEKAADTVKTEMFIDATKIRQYTNVFKDSLGDVSIFTETRGELLKIVPTITIKARLPAKETVFAVYGGGGMYLPLTFEKLSYKVNLRFQNKKGDLWSGSYDPFNKAVFVDYDLRILNIKK